MLAAIAATAGQAVADDGRDAAVLLPILNDILETQRTGVEVPWLNPETGRSGTIRIERTHYRGQQPCRDYTRKTEGGGVYTEVSGTGCRVGPALWMVLEKQADAASAAPKGPQHDPGAAPSRPEATARSAEGDDDAGTVGPVPPSKPPTYTLPTRSRL